MAFIFNEDGGRGSEELFRIENHDGNVHVILSEGVTWTEAAKLFWREVDRLKGSNVVEHMYAVGGGT